jgi:hypothetical protein
MDLEMIAQDLVSEHGLLFKSNDGFNRQWVGQSTLRLITYKDSSLSVSRSYQINSRLIGERFAARYDSGKDFLGYAYTDPNLLMATFLNLDQRDDDLVHQHEFLSSANRMAHAELLPQNGRLEQLGSYSPEAVAASASFFLRQFAIKPHEGYEIAPPNSLLM